MFASTKTIPNVLRSMANGIWIVLLLEFCEHGTLAYSLGTLKNCSFEICRETSAGYSFQIGFDRKKLHEMFATVR